MIKLYQRIDIKGFLDSCPHESQSSPFREWGGFLLLTQKEGSNLYTAWHSCKLSTSKGINKRYGRLVAFYPINNTLLSI